jgi:hypothetical protein
MGVELRCDKRLHGILNDDGVLEISCRSQLCGHENGVVVIHKFNATTGEFIETRRFKDPSAVRRKEQGDALGHSAAVRNP